MTDKAADIGKSLQKGLVLAEYLQRMPEVSAQMMKSNIITENTASKLPPITEKLAAPLLALDDSDRTNDAEARKSIRAAKDELLKILQEDESLKKNEFMQRTILQQAEALFDSVSLEDEKKRKEKQTIVNAMDVTNNPLMGVFMLLMGVLTGNSEMMNKGVEALGLGAAKPDAPAVVPPPAADPTTPAAAPTTPATPTRAADVKTRTSQDVELEVTKLNGQLKEVEDKRSKIKFEDISGKEIIFNAKLGRDEVEKPKTSVASFKENAEKYFHDSAKANVLNGARKNKRDYDSEVIGTQAYEIPIGYNRFYSMGTVGYQSIDKNIKDLEKTKPAVLNLDATDLADYAKSQARKEMKLALATLGAEKFVADPKNDINIIEVSLLGKRNEVEQTRDRADDSRKDYEAKLKEVERLKAIRDVLDEKTGSSWFTSTDDTKKHAARDAINNELAKLTPELKKAEKKFDQELKQFEDLTIQVAKLEEQKRLLQSPDFTVFKQAAAANAEARRNQESYDGSIAELKTSLSEKTTERDQLKTQERAAEVKAAQEKREREQKEAQEKRERERKEAQEKREREIKEAQEKRENKENELKQEASGLGSGGGTSPEASAGQAKSQRRAEVQAEMAEKKMQLEQKTRELRALDEQVRKARSAARVATEASHVPVPSGGYHADAQITTNTNGVTNNFSGGIEAHGTPNADARHQRKIARQQGKEAAQEARRNANHLDYDTQPQRKELQEEIAILKSDIKTLDDELFSLGASSDRFSLKVKNRVKALAETLDIPEQTILNDRKMMKDVLALIQKEKIQESYDSITSNAVKHHTARHSPEAPDSYKSGFANKADAKYNRQILDDAVAITNARATEGRSHLECRSSENMGVVEEMKQRLGQAAKKARIDELRTEERTLEKQLEKVQESRATIEQVAKNISQNIASTLSVKPADVKGLIDQAKELDKQAEIVEKMGGADAAAAFRAASTLISSAIRNEKNTPEEALVNAREKEQIAKAMSELRTAIGSSFDNDENRLRNKRGDVQRSLDDLKSDVASPRPGTTSSEKGINAEQGIKAQQGRGGSSDTSSNPSIDPAKTSSRDPSEDRYQAFREEAKAKFSKNYNYSDATRAMNQQTSEIEQRIRDSFKKEDDILAGNLKPSSGGRKPTPTPGTRDHS